MTLFTDLLSNWGVLFARLRPDLAIPGSPERCQLRHVVEDVSGSLWLLERLAPDQTGKRETIGQFIDSLARRSLHGLAPYRSVHVAPRVGVDLGAGTGHFVLKDWGHCWQLSQFILGEPLVQPDYLGDRSKGESLGAWMTAFREASTGMPPPAGLFPLDLPAYVMDLLAHIASARPDIHERASRVLLALSEFFEAYAELPHCLCHGDVHPMNVIWEGSALLAVIDWEFAGLRPEIYDLANCVGCLALEGGGDFNTPFTRALLDRTLHADLFALESVRMFVPFILATRFGWLSEWMRRADEDMLTFELEYMEFLAKLPDDCFLPGS